MASPSAPLVPAPLPLLELRQLAGAVALLGLCAVGGVAYGGGLLSVLVSLFVLSRVWKGASKGRVRALRCASRLSVCNIVVALLTLMSLHKLVQLHRCACDARCVDRVYDAVLERKAAWLSEHDTPHGNTTNSTTGGRVLLSYFLDATTGLQPSRLLPAAPPSAIYTHVESFPAAPALRSEGGAPRPLQALRTDAVRSAAVPAPVVPAPILLPARALGHAGEHEEEHEEGGEAAHRHDEWEEGHRRHGGGVLRDEGEEEEESRAVHAAADVVYGHWARVNFTRADLQDVAADRCHSKGLLILALLTFLVQAMSIFGACALRKSSRVLLGHPWVVNQDKLLALWGAAKREAKRLGHPSPPPPPGLAVRPAIPFFPSKEQKRAEAAAVAGAALPLSAIPTGLPLAVGGEVLYRFVPGAGFVLATGGAPPQAPAQQAQAQPYQDAQAPPPSSPEARVAPATQQGHAYTYATLPPPAGVYYGQGAGGGGGHDAALAAWPGYAYVSGAAAAASAGGGAPSPAPAVYHHSPHPSAPTFRPSYEGDDSWASSAGHRIGQVMGRVQGVAGQLFSGGRRGAYAPVTTFTSADEEGETGAMLGGRGGGPAYHHRPVVGQAMDMRGPGGGAPPPAVPGSAAAYGGGGY